MLGLQSENLLPTRPPLSSTSAEISALQKALQKFSQNDGVTEFGSEEVARYFQAGKLLLQNHEYVPAQKLLREVLRAAPTSSATIFALADCAGKLGNKEERLQLLRALVTIDDKAEYVLALADNYYLDNYDQEALKYYLHAIHLLPEGAPEFFDIYKNLGNIYVRCHDFESGEEQYNKAHTLNSKSATLLVNFGTLAIQRENWNSAIQRFRDAVAIDPKFDRAWVGLALVHRQFGDFELSWANLARALDLNPLNTTALQLALSWVVKDQRWVLVSEAMKRYLLINSQDAVMSLALAQLWFLQGYFSDAHLELTRALALDPSIQGGAELLQLINQEEKKRSHGWDESREDHRE